MAFQILPLHYPRAFAPGKTVATYQLQTYFSYDGFFFFDADDDGWKINCIMRMAKDHTQLHQSMYNDGLLDMRFRRRIDAVDALQSFLSAVDTKE